METVGIRDLKSRLSRHLKRVKAGVRLVVTDRGRSIATIHPIEAAVDVDWVDEIVREGSGHWSGGKPRGMPRRVSTGKRSASAAVLEGRR
jgi:antitoxin (DNA-binding transcriptional repressor) of toxin-antitoxin stability system